MWPVRSSQWELLDLAGRGKQWNVFHNCFPIPANSDHHVHIQNGDYLALCERPEKGSQKERDVVSPSSSSYQVSPFGNPPGLKRGGQLLTDLTNSQDGDSVQ